MNPPPSIPNTLLVQVQQNTPTSNVLLPNIAVPNTTPVPVHVKLLTGSYNVVAFPNPSSNNIVDNIRINGQCSGTIIKN